MFRRALSRPLLSMSSLFTNQLTLSTDYDAAHTSLAQRGTRRHPIRWGCRTTGHPRLYLETNTVDLCQELKRQQLGLSNNRARARGRTAADALCEAAVRENKTANLADDTD